VTDTDMRRESLDSDEATALLSLLREASTVAAGSTARPPLPLIEADLARGRDAARHRLARRRARVGVGAGMAVATAAAAAAVVAMAQPAQHLNHPQPVSGPATAAAPVMRLASYSLRLPADYRLTAETTSDCPTLDVTFSRPESAAPGHPGSRPAATASRADVPQYASLDATQAHAKGGCIGMVLAPPYTPTAASPDPETEGLTGAHAVQVGRYKGQAGTSTLFAKPSDARSTLEWLYVEIPLANGQRQDLAVSSTGLSQSALISLVANGLTTTSN
jgi:hypothetical protein